MQPSGERDTDISIVPWFCLVFIELDSLLVALRPSVLVCIATEPLHVLAIGGIAFEFFFIAHIE